MRTTSVLAISTSAALAGCASLIATVIGFSRLMNGGANEDLTTCVVVAVVGLTGAGLAAYRPRMAALVLLGAGLLTISLVTPSNMLIAVSYAVAAGLAFLGWRTTDTDAR